jgi:exodeoxyribonuclease VII small subunit
VSPGRPDAAAAGGADAPPPLEEVLGQLEGAVRRLADQSAPLERLVRDWESAQTLAADAERRLDAVERRLRERAEPAP